MQTFLMAIGNEITEGAILNTNTTFLAKHLSEEGFDIWRHTLIKDGDPLFDALLDEAFAQVDLIILTGGLGPTCDDITKNALARYFKSPLKFQATIASDLARRFGEDLSTLQDQATIPEKATFFLNKVGTAPGLVFEKKSQFLVALPGVPLEMRTLFTEEILPYLKRHCAGRKKEEVRKLHFCLLPEQQIDPLLRKIQKENTEIHLGIYPSYGALSVVLKGKEKKVLDSYAKQIKEAFKEYHFESPSGLLSEALHLEFLNRKETLCFAESCTGGRLACEITAHPSASKYFLGSFITYSNELKKNILGVQSTTLEKWGAVSEKTAIEMVNGAFHQSGASWALATTGIAGPTGGSKEKPVGTVWLAMGKKGGPIYTIKLNLKGNREKILIQSTQHALAHLYLLVKNSLKE